MSDAAIQKPARRRTPTLLQMEAVECGAAALGIILGYHGRYVALEELRSACGVSRDGSKASNMLKAARAYGLEGKGYKMRIEKLYQLPMPVIVFWNFNHFLVLEGFGKNVVYLNDPAEGPRRISPQEFETSYTGVVLSLTPGESFRKGGRPPSLIAALRKRASGSERALLFALLAGLALVVPGLVIPTFSQIFVDRVLVRGAQSWLMPLLMGMLLTAALRGILTALQKHFLLRRETKLAITSSSGFLWHVLRLPMEFYTQRYSGEISSRVGLNDRVAAFLSGQLASRAIDAAMVFFFALLMLTYDWLLTLVGVFSVALTVGTTRLVNRRRVDGNRRLLQEQGKATGTLMGGLSTIETLKASGGESDLFSRWAGYEAKFINAHQELAVVTQSFLTVPPLLTSLTTAVVLSLGAFRVMEGDLTMGMLVAFQSLMASFLGPVTNLVSLASNLQEMEGNMNRLDDVERYEVDPQTAADREDGDGEAKAPSKLTGQTELRDIDFGYSRLDAPLVENFRLDLSPGGRVALVGPSGCGKSTVAKLVTGLYQPWRGEVRFDDLPRSEHPRRRLNDSVAIVDQDIALFEGTVRDNLTLWDSTIGEQTLVRATKDACIHDDIMARPGGYDSIVEEGGANFSGGQRQRLEIARALVGNPRILVLDEATSALDAVTEQLIDRQLRKRGCTCIIIAHRLSTIRDADEILVLKKGKVVERGTHHQLIAQPDSLYARLASEH